MNDIKMLLSSYDEWSADRKDLAERDGSPDGLVSSSEWHDSDDSAVELMHHMAKVLRRFDEPGYLTVAEVASRMRVSRMTVYRVCAAGDLPTVKFGHSFRVAEADLNTYLERSALG